MRKLVYVLLLLFCLVGCKNTTTKKINPTTKTPTTIKSTSKESTTKPSTTLAPTTSKTTVPFNALFTGLDEIVIQVGSEYDALANVKLIGSDNIDYTKNIKITSPNENVEVIDGKTIKAWNVGIVELTYRAVVNKMVFEEKRTVIVERIPVLTDGKELFTDANLENTLELVKETREVGVWGYKATAKATKCDISILNGEIKAVVAYQSDAAIGTAFIYQNIQGLISGKQYVLSFDIKSTVNQKLAVRFRILNQLSGGDTAVFPDTTIERITDEFSRVTIDFTPTGMTKDQIITIVISLSGTGTAANNDNVSEEHTIWIKNLSLMKAKEEEIKLETPKNLKIEDDMLSWDHVENASSYAIYNGETLLKNVISPSINLQELEVGDYELSVIAIGENNFINSDRSEVISYTKEDEPVIIEPTELLVDPDFSLTTELAKETKEVGVWGYKATAKATVFEMSIIKKELHARCDFDPTSAIGTAFIYQNVKNLEEKTYVLSFEAKSTVEQKIGVRFRILNQLTGSDVAVYQDTVVSGLTNEYQRFEVVFTPKGMTKDQVISIIIALSGTGTAANADNILGEHTISIRNVSLKEQK